MTLKPESLGKKREHIITKTTEMKQHRIVDTERMQCPLESVLTREQIELKNF